MGRAEEMGLDGKMKQHSQRAAQNINRSHRWCYHILRYYGHHIGSQPDRYYDINENPERKKEIISVAKSAAINFVTCIFPLFHFLSAPYNSINDIVIGIKRCRVSIHMALPTQRRQHRTNFFILLCRKHLGLRNNMIASISQWPWIRLFVMSLFGRS